MIVRVSKKDKSVKGNIHLPPSKSIYNRVLIIRALCGADFHISPVATANDSVLLQKLLKSTDSIINAEDAGTAFRFLTAFLSQKSREYFLTGTDRMRQRPIGILVEALRKLGADISYVEKDGYPPLRIHGKKLTAREIEIDGSVSSQFISALLMIAPTIQGGIQLNIQGEISSKPYIDMTLRLMKEFGVNSEWNGSRILVKEQRYRPKDFIVEADWSAASYWYEMAALSEEADISLIGLKKDSIQGDVVIADIMTRFGVQTDYVGDRIRIWKKSQSLPKLFSYDFKSCPDLFQTMAATCAALNIQTDIRGVENVRIKETDRIEAIETELKKIRDSSTAEINPFSPIKFQTRNDHRMAMCLAPLALKFGEVEIENPEVVSKSYPGFWNDLEKAGFVVEASRIEI
jgi:3-phosphoshikimate 1-carboxyvinyltransferase